MRFGEACRNYSPIVESDQISAKEGIIMLYTLISLLVLFWLIGLVAHIGGGLIHALLVVALCLFVFNLITGRRTV